MRNSFLFAFIAFALGSFFSIMVGGIIVKLWPTIHSWIAATIILFIYSIILYFIYKDRFVQDDESENNSVLTERKYPIIIGFLASALVNLASFENLNTSIVYVDNGSQKNIQVEYKTREGILSKKRVSRRSAGAITLPQGKNIIKLNGNEVNLDISSDGVYIYNVDTLNSYIITNASYGESTTNNAEPKIEEIRKLFFKANVDYIFKAPTFLTARRNDNITKTVIYRQSDLINEYINEEKTSKNE